MNTNTYKNFKLWVKETCINHKKGELPFYTKDTAHAIFAAWYLYKHQLNENEINVYIENDFLKSKKHFYNHGINVNFFKNGDFKKYNYNIIISVIIKNIKHCYSGGGNIFNIGITEEYWRDIVLSIYNIWKKQDNIKNNSYYAFKYGIMCNDLLFCDNEKISKNSKFNKYLSDSEYLIWHCIKHNYNEEDTINWLTSEINKRNKKLLNNGYSVRLSINGYYFKDIFNISNNNFKVKYSWKNKQKLKEYTLKNSIFKYYKWENTEDDKKLLEVKYTLGENTDYNKYDFLDLCYLNLNNNIYDFLDKISDYDILKIFYDKQCFQSEYSKIYYTVIDDIQYSVNRYYGYNIEPINLYLYPVKGWNTGLGGKDYNNKLRIYKENYLSSLMCIWYLFKSLDYTNSIYSEAEFLEYNSKIDFIKPEYPNNIEKENNIIKKLENNHKLYLDLIHNKINKIKEKIYGNKNNK